MPLHHTPRDKLKEIIGSDRSILDHPGRLTERLEQLRDDYGPEVFVLVSTLKARLPQDLLKADQQVSKEARLIRLGKRMMDDLCLDNEAAWWAVETWALALNTATPGELQAMGSKFSALGYVRQDLEELPREKLREALSRGGGIVENPKKLKAILLDLCGDHPPEVTVITSSLTDGLPGELLRPISTEKEVRFAELQQRLQNRLRLNDQAAMWAVLTWAYAMGIIGDKDLGRQQPVSSPAADPQALPGPDNKAQQPPAAKSRKNADIKAVIGRIPKVWLLIGGAACVTIGVLACVVFFIFIAAILVASSGGDDAPPAGYTEVYSESFDTSPGGYSTVSSGPTTWTWYVNGYMVTNASGKYRNNEDGLIRSPYIDLSGRSGNYVLLEWKQRMQTERNYDFCSVLVSKDGGTTWKEVYNSSGGDWTLEKTRVRLDSSYKVSSFRVSFRFDSDGSNTNNGYMVDDVRVYVGNPG